MKMHCWIRARHPPWWSCDCAGHRKALISSLYWRRLLLGPFRTLRLLLLLCKRLRLLLRLRRWLRLQRMMLSIMLLLLHLVLRLLLSIKMRRMLPLLHPALVRWWHDARQMNSSCAVLVRQRWWMLSVQEC